MREAIEVRPQGLLGDLGKALEPATGRRAGRAVARAGLGLEIVAPGCTAFAEEFVHDSPL